MWQGWRKGGMDGGREEGWEWKAGGGTAQAWGLAASGIIRPPAFCVKTGALYSTLLLTATGLKQTSLSNTQLLTHP